MILPGSRRWSGSNPAPVQSAGNPGNVNSADARCKPPGTTTTTATTNIADACNDNPSNKNTGVCYKHPAITNNNADFHYENLANNDGADVRYEYARENGEEDLRWKLETERRNARRRLQAMKGEVERVVGQYRARTERAEAAAASAEKRATVKALQYLRSKHPPS